jgi:hypothetical protein
VRSKTKGHQNDPLYNRHTKATYSFGRPSRVKLS